MKIKVNKGLFVKISIAKNGYNIDDVVYYRNSESADMVEKWSWYFQYLAALLKVKYPKWNVVLRIGLQELLQGDEYIEEKTKNLLIYKRGKVKRLINDVPQYDLFSFYEETRDAKIERLQKEIEALERGEFNYYVPATYINKVKQYI